LALFTLEMRSPRENFSRPWLILEKPAFQLDGLWML
jgi:hypothetical protein